jgi:hypothetical protein
MVWERQGRPFEEVYEILDHLGAGSMGAVSLVRKRPDANRSVARCAKAPAHPSRDGWD